MNPIFQVVEKRALVYCLFLMLIVWALIASYVALSNKKEVILIGIDKNGTRIIDRIDDPIYKTEVVNFIKDFTEKLYNFTPENFGSKVGYAVEFMSSELWKKEKARIFDLKDIVIKEKISYEGDLQKITKNDNGTYTIDILTKKKSKISDKVQNLRITLDLRKTKRSSDNPYGMEVKDFTETVVN